MVKSGKVLFMNADSNRKKQIIDWINEVMYGSNLSLNRTYTLLLQDKTNESLDEFKYIISEVSKKETTLGYILEENVDKFGFDTVMNFLYSNMVLSKIKTKKKTKIPTTRTSKKKLSELKQEHKEDKNIVFGVNKQGEREKAKLSPVIINNKIQYQVRSLKTGKSLKQTEVTKKKIIKLKEL